MLSPIEVWLRQRNLLVTCMVVHEDESTDTFTTRSLDMRGAEREVTSRLKDQGYAPTERWKSTAEIKGSEVVRRFR